PGGRSPGGWPPVPSSARGQLRACPVDHPARPQATRDRARFPRANPAKARDEGGGLGPSGGSGGSLPRADSVLPRRGAPWGSLPLANDHLGFDLLNPDEDLLAQRVRHQVVAAVLVDKLPDQLIEAILGQAGPAFVEVLADLRDVRRVELAVQVGVDPVQHLGTRGLVRVPAAHLSSSPEPLSSPCGPVAEAARTRPRSAA